MGGAGSGVDTRCGDSVGGGRGIGVKAVAPEIDQSALCHLSGKVGWGGFGGVCGAERSDRGRDSEGLDEGGRPRSSPRGGFENNPTKGAFDGSGVDAGHRSLERSGGENVAKCIDLERGEDCGSSKEWIVWRLSLDDRLWGGKGGHRFS